MWIINIIKIVFLLVLVVLAVSDIKSKEIPVAGLITEAVLSCGGAVIRAFDGGFSTSNIVGIVLGLIPGTALIFLSIATRKIGIGDSILFALMGFIESYISVIIVLSVGSVIMAAFSIVLLVTKRVGRNTKLPFVPFMAVGYLINQILLFLYI